MKSSILTLTIAATHASALHVPFTRRIPSRAGGLIAKPVLLAGQTAEIGVSNENNIVYSSTLNVAGKDVPVQVDTGSTDLWLYPYEHGLLDTARDHEDLNLTLTYGIGTITGFVSQIDVTFAGFSVANQSFLNVQGSEQQSLIDRKSTAGLLGLGFDTISGVNAVVEQATGGQTWGRSIMTNIFMADPTTPNHVAFHLSRLYDNNDTDTGSFDIGSFAPGFEAVNNTDPIPIFSRNSTELTYWSIILDAIAINGQNQTLSSNVAGGDIKPPEGKLAVLLDTGYSLPQFTTQLVHDIYTGMGGVLYKRDETNSTYVVPCMTEGNLTLYIAGHTIPIHPLDLTFVDTDEIDHKNFTFCRNAFQPFTSERVDLILGDAFLRNVYSVYDYGDFIDGTSGSPRGDPYIKLLPLTNPSTASAEFKSARAAQLASLPPQVNVSTINSDHPQTINSDHPQTTQGPGSNNAPMRVTMGGVAAMITGVVSIFLAL
ncbi:aspartyl protease [Ceratobasidium sp. AG-Ba]|nr:aspartyl protease [Ceratobasidium sp. AG-Ba]